MGCVRGFEAEALRYDPAVKVPSLSRRSSAGPDRAGGLRTPRRRPAVLDGAASRTTCRTSARAGFAVRFQRPAPDEHRPIRTIYHQDAAEFIHVVDVPFMFDLLDGDCDSPAHRLETGLGQRHVRRTGSLTARRRAPNIHQPIEAAPASCREHRRRCSGAQTYGWPLSIGNIVRGRRDTARPATSSPSSSRSARSGFGSGTTSHKALHNTRTVPGCSPYARRHSSI